MSWTRTSLIALACCLTAVEAQWTTLCFALPGTTEQALGAVYERAYAGATFVRLVGSSLPEIKHVAHTNFCDIGWRVDASGRAILVSVIDNLLKGASGQAVQNMNLMLGFPETLAIDQIALSAIGIGHADKCDA